LAASSGLPHDPALHGVQVLDHVGKGRVESKIIFRAGRIIHWEIVERIPTGFQDG
jgi:hypothetical protein